MLSPQPPPPVPALPRSASGATVARLRPRLRLCTVAVPASREE